MKKSHIGVNGLVNIKINRDKNMSLKVLIKSYLKKWVFNFFLKTGSEEQDLISKGSEFQTSGAAKWKVLWP